jgi:hypothetical protein
MSPARRALAFLFWSLVIYGLFIVPPHGLLTVYRSGLRAVGNVAFRSVGVSGSARFERFSDSKQSADTTLRLSDRATGARGSMEFRANLVGYRPTVFLAALVLTSPIPWRRRGWALLWGSVTVTAFVWLRLWLMIAGMSISHGEVLAVYSFGPFAQRVVEALNKVLVQDATMGYIVPAFIWLLVTFRKDDWAHISGAAASHQGESPSLRARR